MGRESESRSLLTEVEPRFDEEMLGSIVVVRIFLPWDNGAGFKWLEGLAAGMILICGTGLLTRNWNRKVLNHRRDGDGFLTR